VAKLRISYNAPVVLTFAIAAVVAFIIEQTVPATQGWFVAYPHLGDAHSYVGLFTHVLGHASWEHLLGNFMLILLIGPILEERHGSLTLLFMILVTALMTGLANLVFSNGIVMGASGIAFMMILLASLANVRGGEIPLTFLVVALIYMGGEIVKAVHSTDHISHMAHLVGGAAGAAFGFLGARPRKKAAAIVPKI
jgi:membrane associated rhomboid family serine protease